MSIKKHYIIIFAVVIVLILPLVVLYLYSSSQQRALQAQYQEQHFEVLQWHLSERYGEDHDLYVYNTNFSWQTVFWGEVDDSPATNFRLRSAGRERIDFTANVAGSWVWDDFHSIIRDELQEYIQTLFADSNAQYVLHINAHFWHQLGLNENSGWAGLDTHINPDLFHGLEITITSRLYWIDDIELLARQIKEWEQILDSPNLRVDYMRINAVTKCPNPIPCTGPSWWCSHPDDIGSISLTPYQIQNYDLLELLKAHIASGVTMEPLFE